jgi:hypothetical protein
MHKQPRWFWLILWFLPLAAHAHSTAQALIEGLAKLGDDWGGARPQDDDVTLVVLKVRYRNCQLRLKQDFCD